VPFTSVPELAALHRNGLLQQQGDGLRNITGRSDSFLQFFCLAVEGIALVVMAYENIRFNHDGASKGQTLSRSHLLECAPHKPQKTALNEREPARSSLSVGILNAVSLPKHAAVTRDSLLNAPRLLQIPL